MGADAHAGGMSAGVEVSVQNLAWQTGAGHRPVRTALAILVTGPWRVMRTIMASPPAYRFEIGVVCFAVSAVGGNDAVILVDDDEGLIVCFEQGLQVDVRHDKSGRAGRTDSRHLSAYSTFVIKCEDCPEDLQKIVEKGLEAMQRVFVW